MHVSTILKNKGQTIITIRPEEPLAAVAQLLAVNRIGAVLCTDADGNIAGILSERDIVRGLASIGALVLAKVAGDLMTRRVVSCTPNDTIASVMTKMTDGRFRHMPVVEQNRLVGFISIGDVVRFRLEEYNAEMENMRDYVAGRG